MKNIGNIFAAIVICGVSSAYAFVVALFSINQTVLNFTAAYCLACLVISLGFISFKKKKAAFVFAALPGPSLFAVPFFMIFFQETVQPIIEEAPPEFVEACKTAVEKEISFPSLPPTSLAYDWNTIDKPEIGPYLLTKKGRLSKEPPYYRRSQAFEDSIKFTEIKRYSDYGVKISGPKFNRINSYSGIPTYEGTEKNYTDELTADILIYFQVTPKYGLNSDNKSRDTIAYDVTITDRRNNQLISTMRYVVNHKQHRVCGPLKNGRLSVYEFIATSLGYGENT